MSPLIARRESELAYCRLARRTAWESRTSSGPDGFPSGSRSFALRREVTTCTIYNGKLPPAEDRLARVALMMFNDVILRTAFERRLPVIDLRFICVDDEDYANPIEPSGPGGRKIAAAIARALGIFEAGLGPSRVYVG